ncbi:hypothetical protein KI655_18760 [Vibrio sp. D404a]|uniref:hypothetical protein n=1 Tax=unclassified Vibrio TaxID=2614977 RepID=UPI002556C054|nr:MULTISPECIES: hypothetical protein [unclassified Vibrio]MDK9739340.1 hypothetical protein [Vibrio sp. D404a]MDK9797625.1 hypothetical protein [Vibrio sp. D449a]
MTMLKIGYHPTSNEKLFTVRPERMEQFESIQNEEIRYWFALNGWLDEMDISACYHMWPDDGDLLFRMTKDKLSDFVKRDGVEALGIFNLLAEEFLARKS